MMVSSQQVNDVLNLQKIKTNKVNGGYIDAYKAERKPINDAITLSVTSKMQSVAYQALQNASDVRFDKIAPLRERIAAGAFDVTSEQIAQKMVDRLLIDEIV